MPFIDFMLYHERYLNNKIEEQEAQARADAQEKQRRQMNGR